MLASLAIVDAVVLFDEDNLNSFSVLFQMYYKGSDYGVEEIVGHDIVLENGGSVIPIDLLEGYSTTSIIEKWKMAKLKRLFSVRIVEHKAHNGRASVRFVTNGTQL